MDKMFILCFIEIFCVSTIPYFVVFRLLHQFNRKFSTYSKDLLHLTLVGRRLLLVGPHSACTHNRTQMATNEIIKIYKIYCMYMVIKTEPEN